MNYHHKNGVNVDPCAYRYDFHNDLFGFDVDDTLKRSLNQSCCSSLVGSDNII